jgi:hypothetical protein
MGFVFKVTDLGWEYYLVEIITEVVMDYWSGSFEWLNEKTWEPKMSSAWLEWSIVRPSSTKPIGSRITNYQITKKKVFFIIAKNHTDMYCDFHKRIVMISMSNKLERSEFDVTIMEISWSQYTSCGEINCRSSQYQP